MLSILVISSRLALGSVLLIAGLLKLPQVGRFAVDIEQYRLLPRPLGKAVAYTLPAAEILLAASLLAGIFPRVAGGLAALILVGFLLAVGLAVKRGLNVSCSCFGLLYREPVGRRTLIRDSVLLVMALLVFGWGHSAPDISEAFTDVTAGSVFLLSATCVAFGASVAISWVAMRIAGLGHGFPALRLRIRVASESETDVRTV